MLETFLSSQHNIAQQMETLFSQGANSQQIEAWQQQNSAALQAQQQLAISLAAAAPVQPLPLITEIEVPDDATSQMSDFLATQADLENRYSQLYNLQIQTTSGAQASASAAAQFTQQNAVEIQIQQQQAQAIAAQSAQETFPLPPPLVIPPGSSAQMQAFLTLRDQLVRGQIQLHNQYTTSSSATSAAAQQQWQQQNAANFQRLQRLSQNLSTATAIPQN